MARISVVVGLLGSAASWDEGYGRFSFLLPFLAAGVGTLLVRIYTGSERPTIEWKPGDPPPGV